MTPRARNFGEDDRLTRLTTVVAEQLSVLVLHCLVAFACSFLQTFYVQDLNFAATIFDHTCALERVSHGRHARPSDTEHLGKKLLGEGQIITC